MIVIMGPGRCGTTFLVQLLIGLGLDSGGALEIFRERKADVRDPNFVWPELIKGTGVLCHELNEKVRYYKWEVEHVFLCVRKRKPMTSSHIEMKRGKGIYKKLSEEELEATLVKEIPHTIGDGLLEIVDGGYNYTIVEFPRSVQDAQYCYDKVVPVVSVPWATFKKAWDGTADWSLINFG